MQRGLFACARSKTVTSPPPQSWSGGFCVLAERLPETCIEGQRQTVTPNPGRCRQVWRNSVTKKRRRASGQAVCPAQAPKRPAAKPALGAGASVVRTHARRRGRSSRRAADQTRTAGDVEAGHLPGAARSHHHSNTQTGPALANPNQPSCPEIQPATKNKTDTKIPRKNINNHK